MKLKLTAAVALLACSTAFAGTRMDVLNAKCSTTGEMMSVLLQQQNKPYAVNTQGEASFDEAGLAVFAFKQLGIDVPADMAKLSGMGKKISKTTAMQSGDLVFFMDPTNKKVINQMGIVQSVNADGSFSFFYVNKESGVKLESSLKEGFNVRFKQANRVVTDKDIADIKADYQKELTKIDETKAKLKKKQDEVKEVEQALKALEDAFSKSNSDDLKLK